MCRLLGVVSRTDAPVAALVQDELPPFLDLSAEHAHGWGIGWVAADGRVDIRKEPVQASEDRRFAETVTSTVTDAALAAHPAGVTGHAAGPCQHASVPGR